MQGEAQPQAALSEAFDRAVDALAESRADYALIGGLAVAFHGLPRPTRDIDLLYSLPRLQLPGFLEIFRGRGFNFDLEQVILELGQAHLSSLHYGGVRVDLLEAVIPFFQRTVKDAREEGVRGRRVRIAQPEDLIALKMIAAREDDLRDVRGILATQGDRLDLGSVRRALDECCDQGRIGLFEKLLEERRRSGGP